MTDTKNEHGGGCYVLCALLVLGWIWTSLYILITTDNSAKEEAIKHNAAKWTINEQTGERKFVWISDIEKEE